MTQVSSSVVVPFVDDNGVERKPPLVVAPVFSVMLEPGQQVVPTEGDAECRVKVGVSSNASGAVKGTLHLEVPPGWRVEPSQLPVEFHHRGEKQEFEFKTFPASLKEGRANIRAVLESGSTNYSEGYTLVTREDLGSFYYYQPALQRVSIVDVKVPKNLNVGYIMGAGDDIPTVLKQIGMNVALIPADKVANEDLSSVPDNCPGNSRLRYPERISPPTIRNCSITFLGAERWSTSMKPALLISTKENSHLTPRNSAEPVFPLKKLRSRFWIRRMVCFTFPNQITARDFDGWVQERGLYFMDQWDNNFKPLLASHDPGESPQKGGLLRAQYGKGTYIYTGYAFFRQLPAGVPGAIRLYVNLLSAGHESGAGR